MSDELRNNPVDSNNFADRAMEITESLSDIVEKYRQGFSAHLLMSPFLKLRQQVVKLEKDLLAGVFREK